MIKMDSIFCLRLYGLEALLNLCVGLIEEHDSPTRLLENKSSSFAQLVAEYTVRANSSFGK